MSFIPYQVDHSVQNAAKTLGFSKKKVVFKFGFANPDGERQGLTGPACRGSEHEVTFIWSLATGKRQLWLDGKDIHYSESGQNGWTSDRAWQYSFPLQDNTVHQTLKVHFISQPVNNEIPGSRPFDLRVGGISFFSFNQIFQLGTPGQVVRNSNRHNPDTEHMTAEERRLIAQAKLESLKEYDQAKSQQSSHQLHQSLPREEPTLISFDDPPAPAPVGARVRSTGSNSSGPYIATSPYQGYASSITLDSTFQGQAPSPTSAPPGANPYGNMNYGMPSNYGVASPPNPYAPQNYGAPPKPPQGGSYGNTAMAPYQPPAGAPAPSPYAINTNYGAQYDPNGMQQYSPSMQSFSSFGSAPSFAQPPRSQAPAPPPYAYGQPPQQQQQQQQQSYGFASPQQQQQQFYGFASPPPQQQPYY